MAHVPEFVPLLLGVSAVAVVVSLIIMMRGMRGGQVSTIESLLTPFAMPLGTLAFIAIFIAGIGSILLMAGKTTAPIVALVMTIAIMVVAYFASMGGSKSSAGHH